MLTIYRDEKKVLGALKEKKIKIKNGANGTLQIEDKYFKVLRHLRISSNTATLTNEISQVFKLDGKIVYNPTLSIKDELTEKLQSEASAISMCDFYSIDDNDLTYIKGLRLPILETVSQDGEQYYLLRSFEDYNGLVPASIIYKTDLMISEIVESCKNKLAFLYTHQPTEQQYLRVFIDNEKSIEILKTVATDLLNDCNIQYITNERYYIIHFNDNSDTLTVKVPSFAYAEVIGVGGKSVAKLSYRLKRKVTFLNI